MKKIRILIAVVILIVVGSIFGIYYFLQVNNNEQTIEIRQDDEVLYTLNLNEDQIIDINYDGRINTVEIKDGKVHVIYADCPDQTCVEMGYLENLPIVCLPNYLTISYSETDNIDSSSR